MDEKREAEVLVAGGEDHNCSCKENAFYNASCLDGRGRRWSVRKEFKRSHGESLSPWGRAWAGAQPCGLDAGAATALSRGHARGDLVRELLAR